MFEYGFIGAGNMGGALAKSVSNSIGGDFVTVSDKDIKKAEDLALKLGCKAGNCEAVAKNSKFIFLGVKPQVLPVLAEEISNILAERNDEFILITMAAGVSISSLKEMFKVNCPIIRIMPNTPVLVNNGMILYSLSENVTSNQKEEFLKILSKAGELDELREDLIDIGSCVSGCGPAFSYMFIEALAKGGERFGLPKEKALKYAIETVLGAASLIKETNESPETLIKNVCSPGGSTIEGVKILEKEDIYSLLSKTVEASFKRTIELGKNK